MPSTRDRQDQIPVKDPPDPDPAPRLRRIRRSGPHFLNVTYVTLPWLHVHHCQPWTSTGETTIENLMLLCGTHHRTIHNHHITIRRHPTGTLILTHQHGDILTSPAPTPLGPNPLTSITTITGGVTPTTIHPDGTGPLSLDDSLYILLNNPPINPTNDSHCDDDDDW